jgi:hypothetical protein
LRIVAFSPTSRTSFSPSFLSSIFESKFHSIF